MAWYIAEKERQHGGAACVLKLCYSLESPLGICLAPGSPFPRVGWVCSQWGGDVLATAVSSQLSWSLSALCPSCLVDWVHLTRVLLAQKPQQHLGMGNPALKELLGSAAADVQCPSSASAQPMTWEILDRLYLFWRGLWHGAISQVWCK